MVVGMAIFVFAPLVPQNFQRPVGNHLVGIHVGRSARSALHHVHHEMIVQRPALDLLAGRDDRRGDRSVQLSQVAVGHGGSLLHVGQRPDQLGKEIEPYAADVEILQRAHGLDSEIILFGDVHVPEQVMFLTGLAREGPKCYIHTKKN